jgi:spore germination cell wall hydrolase CwlJ-like protein
MRAPGNSAFGTPLAPQSRMSQSGILLLFMALAAQNQHAHAQQAQKAETSCLAQALYYEARGEGERGQEAVAEVILDRARSGTHGRTVCSVLHEPGQFSYLTDGSTLRKIDTDAWQSAEDLASRILDGKVVTGITQRALYYHAVSVRPDWADTMVRTVQIGNHVFYRERRRTS